MSAFSFCFSCYLIHVLGGLYLPKLPLFPQADILKPKKDITAAFHKYLAVILGERTEAAEDAMFTRKVKTIVPRE